MVVLGCLGLSMKKNDSVKKTTNDDEHAIVGYNLDLFRKTQLSMIDIKSTRVRKVSGLESSRGGGIFCVVNNCNGLIMLIHFSGSCRQSVIFNPKSNKIVKRITPPAWLFYGVVPVGLYYHPLAKEYRTLNVIAVQNNRYEYHIYQFGFDTWRAALNPYFHLAPSEQRPACTKQALYWCCKTEDKIVVFDIISEQFCTKPFPVCGGMEKDLHTPPKLVAKNNEESLCCCYAHRAEFSIDVWVLEDYANWSWNRKYVVNLNCCKAEDCHSEAWRAFAKSAMSCVKVVSIQKDELVFYYQGDDSRSLYSYNLESGFSVRTQLSKTDWKGEVDKIECYCGFIGL